MNVEVTIHLCYAS